MTISVYSLGTASSTAGATVVLGGITVPAGAFIFIAVYEKNIGGNAGTLSDSAGNNFIPINDANVGGNIANGHGQTFEVFNAKAMVAGSLTYAKSTSGVFTSISAFYATGILRASDPLDIGSVSQSNFTSIDPSAGTSLSFSPELVVCAVCWVAGAGDTFAQDTPGGWSFPPDTLIDSVGAAGIAGGWSIPNNSSPFYGPFLNNSRPWTVFIQAFQSEPTPPVLQDDVTLGVSVA